MNDFNFLLLAIKKIIEIRQGISPPEQHKVDAFGSRMERIAGFRQQR
jgi:hypothetical protein